MDISCYCFGVELARLVWYTHHKVLRGSARPEELSQEHDETGWL